MASISAASLASVPGVGEEHLGVGDAAEIGDLLGQLDLVLDEIERRRVQHLVGLGLDRGDDLGHLVPGHGGEDPAEEVEVLVALGVGDPPPLAVDQGDRLLVVERHPRWQHLAVTGQQVGVASHVVHGATRLS